MKIKQLNESEAIAFLSRASTLVLDLETTGLNPRTDTITDVMVMELGAHEIYKLPSAQSLLALSPDARLIGQNLKFDLHFLCVAGVDLRSRGWRDTMLMDHLVDENQEHGLGPQVLRHFGDNYKAEFWTQYPDINDAPEEARMEYAAKDVLYTEKLYLKHQAATCHSTLVQHVHRLACALLDTEIAGIAVDMDYLLEKGITLKAQLEDYAPKMHACVAPEIAAIELAKWQVELEKRVTPKGKAGVKKPRFSFASQKDLVALLYGELGLPEQTNQKTKAVSTDYDALVALKDAHPLIPLLQDYRDWTKVYTAYIEGTLERQESGRIYPSFSISGTKTGRISHSNPNMAQLPSSGGIRGIYVPDPGQVLITADYSQLEIVILAKMSGDAALNKMLSEGLSQHDITAEGLGIPRSQAKGLNFAMAYRCSPRKVAQMLEVSVQEGEHIWNKYWEVYSGVKALMDATDAKLARGEVLTTAFGRKRHFPKVRQAWEVGKQQRQGFNFLVQSTGSDITSQALYTAHQRLKDAAIGKALFSVHDECLVTAVSSQAHLAESLLCATMIEVGAQWGYSLKVQSSGPCDRWSD